MGLNEGISVMIELLSIEIALKKLLETTIDFNAASIASDEIHARVKNIMKITGATDD